MNSQPDAARPQALLPLTSQPALAERVTRHDLPFDGGHVAWRRAGEGPPLVLLHGGHGSWAHWARNIDTLLGAQTPIHLAGFSFGGLVAARLAARRGAVAALALLGPAGHGGPRRTRGDLLPWRDGAGVSADDAALREVMRHNLELHMLAGPADEAALAIHTQACLRTRFHSKRISGAGGLGDTLAALHCPVMLLWGEHDVTATPTALAPTLAGRCRQAHTLVVPGAGHWVQYEAADRVNRLLTDWFDKPSLQPVA